MMNATMNRKIGIVGLGFLGGAMDRYFTEQGFDVYRYDKKGVGSQDEVDKADIIFICVNTPFDGKKQGADMSYVESAVRALTGEKIIVIHSTVPPGTTDALQKELPQHSFLFNPEFLRAATAYEDFKKPSRQIIGVTEKSKDLAREMMLMLPKAPTEYTKILPARAAELIKYAANVMLAAKVAMGNKIFDYAKALGIDYDGIKDLIGADERIGAYGLQIFYQGFRGYNGACFPKDVRTFIVLGEEIGVDVGWLKAMDDANLRLLKSQRIEPAYGYPTPSK